jgi:2-hydroxy-3-keto-5-methylthiopentenyl-1-phosphate phosphatase
MMSQKDFLALADTVIDTSPNILSCYDPDNVVHQAMASQWVYMRNMLADYCARSNSKFSRVQWMDYIDRSLDKLCTSKEVVTQVPQEKERS